MKYYNNVKMPKEKEDDIESALNISNSYVEILKKYIAIINPQIILEWGPGNSTLTMIQYSNAEIYTIEHDIYWYTYWKSQFAKYSNIHLYHFNLNENYEEAPLYFPITNYDLIFIDGRHRVNCMKVAKNIVSEFGVIILHDCYRYRYREGKMLLNLIEESSATCVFSK